ncbi:MAG: hypothetical protein WBP13_01015 [Methylophilaceae bacterium]
MVDFIERYYPHLNAQLTIGGVILNSEQIYKLDESTISNWLTNDVKPNPLGCHIWITIGNKIIINATIGTNLVAKKYNRYGGIIYGYKDDLKWLAIEGVENKIPDMFKFLNYNPIAVGNKVFSRIS